MRVQDGELQWRYAETNYRYGVVHEGLGPGDTAPFTVRDGGSFLDGQISLFLDPSGDCLVHMDGWDADDYFPDWPTQSRARTQLVTVVGQNVTGVLAEQEWTASPEFCAENFEVRLPAVSGGLALRFVDGGSDPQSHNPLLLEAGQDTWKTLTTVPQATQVSFRFVQGSPSMLWEVDHDIPYQPAVTTVDSGGTTVFGDVTYETPTRLTIEFGTPFAGEAFLS